jgi:hypothetical protein
VEVLKIRQTTNEIRGIFELCMKYAECFSCFFLSLDIHQSCETQQNNKFYRLSVVENHDSWLHDSLSANESWALWLVETKNHNQLLEPY